MALRLPNDKQSRTPKENMLIAETHFTRQFNVQPPRYANAVFLITRRECMFTLDRDISFEEFKKEGVMQLKNDNAPGVTGALSQALKLLGDENMRCIYKYVVNFWNGTADY